MAFASYYSFPPLSFQLNSLYEGDPFQLNNFEGSGFCRQPARLWFGGCGSGWGAGVKEVMSCCRITASLFSPLPNSVSVQKEKEAASHATVRVASSSARSE